VTFELLALAATVAMPLLIRLIDYLLPTDRRFTILDRFTTPIEEDDDDETT